MNEDSSNGAEQAAAFQKIWLESMSKLLQTAFTFGADSAPPEMLRQIRSGIFEALGRSWEEFMRSPQFLEGMRQWMDQAVTIRKMTNDLLANARNEAQAPSREDIDTIMLAVRHLEKRLLDRLEELSAKIEALNKSAGKPSSAADASASAGPGSASPKSAGRRPGKKPKPSAL